MNFTFSSGENVEAGEKSLSDNMKLSFFPAKLWRLINDPTNKAIWWDRLGEIVVIDQYLFEKQLLSPSPNTFGFKTTNFSSFLRQLNLYGFRKISMAQQPYFCFQSPYFKRNRPDLVAELKRLTVGNKAKLEAGLEITTQAPNRSNHLPVPDGGSYTDLKTGIASPLFSTHEQSARLYSPKGVLVTCLPSGTQAPPQFLTEGHGGAFSSYYPVDKMMPAYFKDPRSGQVSTAVQGLMGLNTAPVFSSFSPRYTQFQPGYFSPVCQCCCPQQSGLQDRIFSPSYYTVYPLSGVYQPNLLQQNRGSQEEMMSSNIDLNTVFQVAEETMPTPSSNCVVKVDCPEPPSFSEAASGASGTTWWTNSCNTRNAYPFPNGPVVGSRSSFCPLYRGRGECVVPLPEHVLQDARSEVTSQERRDTVIKYSTVRQTCQK